MPRFFLIWARHAPTDYLDRRRSRRHLRAIHAEEGYQNRSEAFRDLLRGELDRESLDQGGARHCVAALSYVYNHHEHQLAGRLAQFQHDHHDVTVSTMHAHLDHDNCIETMILRGPRAKWSDSRKR